MLERTKSFEIKTKQDNRLYKVQNGLYIGTVYAARNYEKLKEHNITHIVNATPQIELCHFKDKIKYFELNIVDSKDEKLLNHFEKVNNFIHNAIKNNGNVLIHCYEGISRAPTLCASYLIQYYEYDHLNALKYLKDCKSNINPNNGFRNQLYIYDFIN